MSGQSTFFDRKILLSGLRLIRPKEWIKNLFLFIPIFFAGELPRDFHVIASLFFGFCAFSFAASSIYVLNDYMDVASDRLHPTKKLRPIASGAISENTAIAIMLIIMSLAIASSLLLPGKFLLVIVVYLVLNILYSLGLKNISILDILIVAAGFVIRIKAGGVAADVPISIWLNIMVFLLALFIAIAKRRDDVLLKIQSGLDMRKAIKGYNLDFLNISLSLVTAVTLVSYLMYSVSPEVVSKHNHYRLYYTCIFVVAGVLRYLQICFVTNDTGSPTQILYRDRFIQITLCLWILSFCFILYVPDFQLFKN